VQGSEPLRPPSAAAAAGFGVFVLLVASMTAVYASGLVGLNALAASPSRVFAGRVWLLVTSGLLVQKPLALSLVSFAALGTVTLGLCRWRVLATAGLVGHVGSTLLVYCALVFARSVVHGAFGGVWSAPDYGVSAISAAWLGALASIAWRQRGTNLVDKMPVIFACAAIVAFSWIVHRSVNVLDSEHVIAFLVGGVIAWRAVPAAGPFRSLLRSGSARRAAIVVACVLLALGGASFADALRSLTAPDLPVARLAAAAQSLATSLGDPGIEHAHAISIRVAASGGSPFTSVRTRGERQLREYLIVIRGRFACLGCSLPAARRTSLATFAAATWTPRQGLRNVYLSRVAPTGLKRLGKPTSIKLP
jgi:hypothetical protein